MSDNNILTQLGLTDEKGDAATDGKHGVNALHALRLLIESGKVSLEDAKTAVQSARQTARDEDGNAISNIEDGNNNNTNRKNKGKKNNNQNKATNNSNSNNNSPTIKYRTRHVALQFSYDGTDYSGFAENIGKEYDNSVEKTLFAALTKTRLLVCPDQHGMLLVDNNNDDNNKGDKKGESDGVCEGDKRHPGETRGGEAKKPHHDISARSASRYSRCGRTDKGVHAHGQVVALYLKSAFPLAAQHLAAEEEAPSGKLLEEGDLPKNSLDGLECMVPPKKTKQQQSQTNSAIMQRKTITECDYTRILNNILPPSIRILGWCPVSTQFSARFSCSQRTYRYFFPRRNLDLRSMAQALGYMMGNHDFRNLCKMNCEQVYNFERVLISGKVVSSQGVYSVCREVDGIDEIMDVDVSGSPTAVESPHDICHVQIVGQAFLWHQIRCIMSLLFMIGRKLEPPTVIQQLFDIEANPAKPAYEMASDTALVLHDCKFGHLNLGRTVRNLWDVTKVLEQRWETHAVAAERANDALVSVKANTEVRWEDVVEFVKMIARERRRKAQKRTGLVAPDDEEIQQALDKCAPQQSVGMLSWGYAVNIIQEVLEVYPYQPNGSGSGKGLSESSVHTPLMERPKGTTYEQKVQSILGEGGDNDNKNGKSSKRKERYEDNIIKKRKTKGEDKAFYQHMRKQGGSAHD